MDDKAIVHDLDVLRPSPEYVKLAGKKIDISFIPSGVALDIMAMRQKLEELTNSPEKIKKIEKGGGEALESFDLSAGICAKITESQHSEMTKEWLLKNTDVLQLQKLIEHVTNAVFSSLEGAKGDPGKNQTAIKQESP